MHFISGLPRAGSTLLSALLNQNPRFHAGMTSPVGSLVEAMLRAMSMSNENAVFIDDDQRATLLAAIFQTFHRHPDGHVAFDTNRSWCSKLPLLTSLFPRARVICCVRDIPSILNSVERLVRENALQPSGIFSFDPGGTVYSRAEGLAGGGGMIGFAWNALREAFYGPHSDRLVLLTYESLTRDPDKAMRALYAFLEEPAFAHDFENVVFDAAAFDRRIGTPGLHAVGRQVRQQSLENMLPPDLVHKYNSESFWLNPEADPKRVPVI